MKTTITSTKIATVHSIEPVVSRIFRRGDGRRYRNLDDETKLTVPEQRDIAELATHQIHLSWRSLGVFPKVSAKFSGLEQPYDIVAYLGGSTISRPPQSKILLTNQYETIYYFVTWTDLFGAAIKESQLGQKRKDGWILYAIEAPESEKPIILDALAIAIQ